MKSPGLKLSAKDVAERLAQIRVLIADGDRRIALIIHEVLSSIGFRLLHIARDGSHALQILASEDIHMVITDWQMSPMDGMTLVQYLRRSPDSPNRFIPIIMLTGNADKTHVETARDSGVTEFVVKPFSAKTLFNRVQALIEEPRSFILCKAFIGPDRRRRSGDAPQGKEKRRKKHGRK